MLISLGTYRVKRKRRRGRGEGKNRAQGQDVNGTQFL